MYRLHVQAVVSVALEPYSMGFLRLPLLDPMLRAQKAAVAPSGQFCRGQYGRSLGLPSDPHPASAGDAWRRIRGRSLIASAASSSTVNTCRLDHARGPFLVELACDAALMVDVILNMLTAYSAEDHLIRCEKRSALTRARIEHARRSLL